SRRRGRAARADPRLLQGGGHRPDDTERVMSEYTKPLPDLDDPLTAPFWTAARDGRLVAQRCANCGYLRWPPGPVCNECLTPGGEWAELSPHGTLYSYAEYHRALDPAFKA